MTCMNRLKGVDVQQLCEEAGLDLTQKQKRDRKLMFCSGCVRQCNTNLEQIMEIDSATNVERKWYPQSTDITVLSTLIRLIRI